MNRDRKRKDAKPQRRNAERKTKKNSRFVFLASLRLGVLAFRFSARHFQGEASGGFVRLPFSNPPESVTNHLNRE
jgi:hypothetical protein